MTTKTSKEVLSKTKVIKITDIVADHTGAQNLYAVQLYQNEGVYHFNNTAAVTITLQHPVYILVSPVSSEYCSESLIKFLTSVQMTILHPSAYRTSRSA